MAKYDLKEYERKRDLATKAGIPPEWVPFPSETVAEWEERLLRLDAAGESTSTPPHSPQESRDRRLTP